jgi:hypothetical protein
LEGGRWRQKLREKLWEEEMTKLREEGRKQRAADAVLSRKLPPAGESRAELDKRLAEVRLPPLSDRQWQYRERMVGRNPAELTLQAWQEWQASPASVTLEGLANLKDSLADRRDRRESERQKRAAYGWENDPADMT